MITVDDVIAAREYAQGVLGGDCTGHDISHARRVAQNARNIIEADALDVDVNLVELCCYLHDVDDRKLKPAGEPEFFRLNEFFSRRGLSDSDYERAKGVIGAVSFSKNGGNTDGLTLEAMVVRDADRLDALGAIGIARAFAYGGAAGRPIYGEHSSVGHFYDKLFLLPDMMCTAAARRVARARAEYMRGFLDELAREAGEALTEDNNGSKKEG